MFVSGVMNHISCLVSFGNDDFHSITREKELRVLLGKFFSISIKKPLQVYRGKVFPYIFYPSLMAVVIVVLDIFIFICRCKAVWFLLAVEKCVLFNK